MDTDHCIDSIRQAIMCHANTAAYTAEWVEDHENEGNNNDKSHLPVIDKLRPDAITTCVKWDGLDNWARQRALVPGKYRFLPGANSRGLSVERTLRYKYPLALPENNE